MKRMRFTVRRLAAGFFVVSVAIALSGCGEQVATESKAKVESKRDELQKKTQSGIPGKGTPKPAH